MANVPKLVARLWRGPEVKHDWTHTQTVKISQEAHHKLLVLAQVMGRSKSALAGDLLEAAIQDAVEALPTEPANYYEIKFDTGGSHTMNPREYVEWKAQDLYEDFLEEETPGGQMLFGGESRPGPRKEQDSSR